MVIRVLPFEEWDKLDGFQISANGLPDPDTSIILVAETPAGEIVGTWEAVAPVILEGLWVREDHRNSTVAGRMLSTMKSLLKNMNISKAYTIVQTSDVKALAEKAGFEMIPGEFCVLDLDKN